MQALTFVHAMRAGCLALVLQPVRCVVAIIQICIRVAQDHDAESFFRPCLVAVRACVSPQLSADDRMLARVAANKASVLVTG